MHAVAQTHAFVAQAKAAGMTDAQVDSLVTFIAENPDAGDMIQGTGGCRKIRVAGRGKGKSGGYRTISSSPERTFLSSCWRFLRRESGAI